MRGQWLFLSIASLCILYFPSYFLFWIMIFGIFHWKRFRKGHFLFFILLMMVCSISYFYTREVDIPKHTIIEVKDIKANYVIGCSEKQNVMIYGLEGVNYGDIIEFEGSYEKIEGYHNFGEFHFPTWANRKRIYYQANAESFRYIKKGEGIRSWWYSIVHNLSQREGSSTTLTFLFGIRNDSEEDDYLMTSSGLHMNTLARWIQRLLTLWFSTSTSTMISTCIFAIAGSFTVMTTAFKRILCFHIVSLVCKKYDEKDCLGISIYILVCLFPYMIYEIAFILPVVFRFIHIFNIKKVNRWIISYLVLIPIQLHFYGSVDLLQIILFPFIRIFYALLYMLSWLSTLIPFFISILDSLYDFITQQLQGLPVWKLYYASNSIWLLAWSYITLKYISYKQKKDICILIFLLVFTQIQPYLNPFGEILIMDIGQGDSTLITLPFYQGTMLIDVAGNKKKNIPQDIIYPILRKKGIRKLDYVVITHDDFDHSGGLEQLEQLIEIKEVIRDKQEKIVFGNVEFAILLHDREFEDKNENSLVLFSELYGLRALFMGDAGIEVEKEILKKYPLLQTDILKIGHHGSKTSTSLPFLHEIQPTLGLISAGRNNFYGHPNEEVLDVLKQENVHILCTSYHGAIQIKFSKFINFYRTADKEFGIIH